MRSIAYRSFVLGGICILVLCALGCSYVQIIRIEPIQYSQPELYSNESAQTSPGPHLRKIAMKVPLAPGGVTLRKVFELVGGSIPLNRNQQPNMRSAEQIVKTVEKAGIKY